jgi:hypothetical protein
MQCPQCNKTNSAGSRFCQFCGAKMGPETAVATPISASQPTRAVPSQVSTPLAQASSVGKPASSPAYQATQVGAGGTSTFNIWGPFAGYGTRRRHVSWLLDDLGQKAEALHNAVTDRFKQRQVPGSNMHWVTLVAQGLIVERRPFYFVRRGITTVALYIARFGQDLYISQVTYMKSPISNVRVAIVGLMLLFWLYSVTLYQAALVDSLSGFDPFFGTGRGFPFFLLCVVGPLSLTNNFALLLLFLFSIYKWLREKDFLAVLRRTPNEFQEDDTIALEKAVEETVRQSLDKIGIDVNLMPRKQDYGSRGRLI